MKRGISVITIDVLLFLHLGRDDTGMKRLMTTEELFNEIQDILKENNKLQDILDYGLAAHYPVPVTTYQFDLKSNLAYGGNEGICLSLWIEHYEDGEKRLDDIGNFKTLHGDREAMHIMAGLLADFIIEEYAYVNARLDDFKWGVRHPVDTIVRDNATRKEKVYKQSV